MAARAAGTRRPWSHKKRPIEECVACGKQHSILAGTIFEQTKTGLARWFLAIDLATSSTGGISAMELQRQMGFGSYQTAWSWLHKIRRAMVRPERAPLAERVEADETYVGGAPPGRPGRGAAGKTVVAGALEAQPGKGRQRRLGRLRLAALPDASAASLQGFLARNTAQPLAVTTDGWSGYLGAGRQGLRPRGDQPQPQLGRRQLAPAGGPPRLQPRQALAPRHSSWRRPAQASPGLSR